MQISASDFWMAGASLIFVSVRAYLMHAEHANELKSYILAIPANASKQLNELVS